MTLLPQEEIWKDVSGYEGQYMVSNLGRVRSVGRQISVLNGNYIRIMPDRIMSLSTDFNGYKSVFLRRPKQHTRFLVHRLVASTFISNPESKAVVNHKDRNRTNNHVSNLEWASFSENTAHWYADNMARQATRAESF